MKVSIKAYRILFRAMVGGIVIPPERVGIPANFISVPRVIVQIARQTVWVI